MLGILRTVSTNEVKPRSSTVWVDRASLSTNGRIGARHVQVSFERKPEAATIACKIISRAPFAPFEVVSGPLPSREVAFVHALDFFVQRFEECAQARRMSRAAQAKAAEQGLKQALKELLPKVVKAWRAEHAWLMKNSSRGRKESARILRLSHYFVLLDPLRCHEIDPWVRPQLLESFEEDVAVFLARRDSRFKKQKIVDWLRALAGKRFAEPGSPLNAGADFTKEVSLYGETPDEALDFLIKENLVRRERGLLFLSTRGTNRMEEMLTSDMSPTSLIVSLPTHTAAMLFELKALLTK